MTERWPPVDLTPREVAEASRALCRWRDQILNGCVTWDHYSWLAEVCELIADFRGRLQND